MLLSELDKEIEFIKDFPINLHEMKDHVSHQLEQEDLRE